MTDNNRSSEVILPILCDGAIFDLDGTLWDATGVTAETWVSVLAGHPDVKSAMPLTQESVKRYMGLTNEELAEVFFPDLPYEKAFALMMESCALENKWLPERGGILFHGVAETLGQLHDNGFRLFIVSNCQRGYIESFLHAHGLSALFEDFESSGNTGLPKADNIDMIIKRRGLSHPAYIGDTISDSSAAGKCGIPFIYAKYGFGEQCGRGKTDDYCCAIEDFTELLSVLEPDDKKQH